MNTVAKRAYEVKMLENLKAENEELKQIIEEQSDALIELAELIEGGING